MATQLQLQSETQDHLTDVNLDGDRELGRRNQTVRSVLYDDLINVPEFEVKRPASSTST